MPALSLQITEESKATSLIFLPKFKGISNETTNLSSEGARFYRLTRSKKRGLHQIKEISVRFALCGHQNQARAC